MPERFFKNTDSGAHERAVRIRQFAENREVIGASYRKNPRLSPAPSFPVPVSDVTGECVEQAAERVLIAMLNAA
jgi:hypothetical protein